MKVAFVFTVALILVVVSNGPSVHAAEQSVASKIEDLRDRVAVLEDNVEGLQNGVNDFSKTLVRNVDLQLQRLNSKAVVINPLSRKVLKIETNTGAFLLAVSRMDKIDKGYRLYLQIGNANAATYGDVKFRFFWGSAMPSLSTDNKVYEKWRQSLTGAEFAYTGTLEAGVWTDIAVELKPAEYNQLQYVECEMEVNTVRLQKSRVAEAENLPR